MGALIDFRPARMGGPPIPATPRHTSVPGRRVSRPARASASGWRAIGIGLILLMGIAKKNSIILVDYTNQLRRQGHDRDAAPRRARPVRLRPILMTSVATIAGALPAALALGPGAETRIPMSLAVIGGMIVSTFMTLFVVPAGDSVLDEVTTRLAARRATVPAAIESTTVADPDAGRA
jgi:AcrB/AcrD/AcrF family protein